MKRNPGLLLSLAANAVLVCVVIRLSRPPPPVPAPDAATPSASTAQNNSAGSKSSFDFAQWIRQSRTLGIADDVLAELVAADFNNKWSTRQRDFDRRYWQGRENNASRMRFEQQRDTELEQAIRSTLGEQAFVAWDKPKILGPLNAEKLNLPPADEDALYRIQKNWNRFNVELQRQQLAGEIGADEFARQFATAQSEYEQQCRTLLGDDRYATLQQPADTSGLELRRSLGTLTVTDAQFDALARANQELSARRTELERSLNDGRLSPADYSAQLASAETAKEQAWRDALGAGGYADFQKRQDSRYEMLRQNAADWQLTASDVEYLYRLTHDYEQSVRDYRRRAQQTEEQGQVVDWPAVQQNLQLFTRQTMEAIRNYLGDDRFARVKEDKLLEPEN